MSANAAYEESPRRLLLIGYRFDPDFSMESRLVWQRALTASRDYHVTVLCAVASPAARAASPGRVDVLQVSPHAGERLLARLPGGFALAYANWQRRAARAARAQHAQTPFAVAHHVSYCGFRQPSLCWQLDIPYVWGPIGGTHAFPSQFLGAIDRLGAVREVARNAVNALQLRWSPAVSRALAGSTTVLAASRQTERELVAAGRRVDGVMLETGVDPAHGAGRPQRNAGEPLRILWAGRACSWKALPLLLHALADLPTDCRFQLRVMAAGARLVAWQRLARRLMLDDHVEWVGWPGCQGRQPHYQWADAFAFTSLRDTSGTGLLESLAAGAPVIGLNHQGAADVMSDDCALKIEPTTPAEAIAGFRDAISRLAGDPALLARLSAGALRRAERYHWSRQGAEILAVYERAIAAGHAPAPAQPAWPSQSSRGPQTSAVAAAANRCKTSAPQ